MLVALREKSGIAAMATVVAAEELGRKFVSPAYWAITVWFPCAGARYVPVARPLTSVAFAASVVPSRKSTSPVGLPAEAGETVAVSSNGSPA